MPNMSLDERRKALYPELFMSASEREQATARLAEKMSAEMGTPAGGLDATMANSLGSSANALWQVVAPTAIDAVTKQYFDLSKTNHVVETGLTNNPNVRPVVHVEVVKGAGEVMKDATDWEQTALDNSYVPVTLHRYSRSFCLYNNDIMKGERIATKLAAAVETVVSGVVKDFFDEIYNNFDPDMARCTVDLGTFGPEFVAHNISGLFGEFGRVDDLILSPSLFAKLVPVNALSLGTAPGTYGIGEIHCSARLGVSGGVNCAGFALRKSGVAVGFGLPDLSNMPGIAVRSLGTVAGIPLIVKSWVDAKTEGIWNSVETMAGFTVADKKSCGILEK